MAVLVFVELSDGEVKKSSREAVTYASAMGNGEVVAVVLGTTAGDQLKTLGNNGANKVLHANNPKFDQGVISAYASALAEAMQKTQSDCLVLAESSLGNPVAARVSIKIDASLVTNVVALPDAHFNVKRSIYTGKASAHTTLTKDKKILSIKKGAVILKEDGPEASIGDFNPSIEDSDFGVKQVSREKTTGKVLLPEADIVVSGGRGLKGPENWGMIEDLAEVLGAATGCSKPVSDMDWRPHHEHVGQTGIKVAPTLYIAIGISGAIQHLAGVNQSKYIVVINKDADAPFFKAADYGVVGDAFEVVPKLTEAIKAIK
jgi:electron transfer flavoprotein alpha subunit